MTWRKLTLPGFRGRGGTSEYLVSMDWYLTALLGNITSLLFAKVKFAFLIDKLTVAANFKCKHFLRFVLLAEACYKILVKH